jgi:phosphoadenosine phosphosulfate reductase
MTIEGIRKRLGDFNTEGRRMFLTSSFQTQSVPLLHIISQIDPSIPVYFLNTGFLFPQTLKFKNDLANRFGLNVVGLESNISKIHQKDSDDHFYYSSDPDYCCHINKILPLEPVLLEFDVWINGIRADQNANRKNMKPEQMGAHNVLRYHPILDWTQADVEQYIQEHNLPTHPMDKEGYISIGCEPCTMKPSSDNYTRDGRWAGMKKTECGLHTDLASEKPAFNFKSIKNTL